ncbi:hypothetical protein CDAR_30451 [Caerostris darwini]|uniref:Uncharacterized protein n=1 Tax=Caerostris darwini TaxID=1538125 RepID=A0AAV4VW19_9ARAC|nr:hypothetical protein CDAR_30451 [Caerostris darwini]
MLHSCFHIEVISFSIAKHSQLETPTQQHRKLVTIRFSLFIGQKISHLDVKETAGKLIASTASRLWVVRETKITLRVSTTSFGSMRPSLNRWEVAGIIIKK